MKKNKFLIILSVFTIFVLSLSLRLYRLEQNVPSLYADEVGGSYLSLNLLHTPIQGIADIFTKAFSGISLMSWAFGLTPLGTRLPSALFGSLISIVVFYLARIVSIRLLQKKSLATPLLSGLLAAVLPWSYMISRIGHTSIPIVILLSCIHISLLVNAKISFQFLVSFIPLGIGILFYPSIIIIAPVEIFILYSLSISSFNQEQRKKHLLIFILSATIIIALGISRYQILNPKTRGLDLAIWRDVNVTADSNYYRGLSRLSSPTIFSFGTNSETIANKILFNYPTSVIRVFAKNYLSFFSPDFLFLKGDSVLRHSTGMTGEFFSFLIPFMLYGAFVFFTKADKKLKAIFLVWIFISPVPAAITKDGATYLLRAITMMPFLTYSCALGIVASFDFFKNKVSKLFYGLIVFTVGIFSIYSFIFGYFHVFPALSASHWEYGFKELSDFQVSHPGKLLIVWEDKYPVWYFCFWQKLPSNVCDQTKLSFSETVADIRVDLPTDDLIFTLPTSGFGLDQIIRQYHPDFIAVPAKYQLQFPDLDNSFLLQDSISYPDQTTAFSIYKNINI